MTQQPARPHDESHPADARRTPPRWTMMAGVGAVVATAAFVTGMLVAAVESATDAQTGGPGTPTRVERVGTTQH